MAVLLLAEIVGGEISIDQTGKALSAVKKLGDVTLLCAQMIALLQPQQLLN